MTGAYQPFEDLYFTSRDGLKLYARKYPAAYSNAAPRRPVVCLAGLTRNCRDFHHIALALSQDTGAPRDVYALDYRGRGLSQSDPDWRNYTVPIEALDVLDFYAFMGLHGAALIATSRGGLITMVMGALQPSALGPVVLNDIGAVIEQKGLSRISAYVGRIPLPGNWADATKLVRDMGQRTFPALGPEEWEEIAHQWFNERKGKPAPGYDSQLSNALSVLDGPIPALWPQFETLKRTPVLVLRGQHSDILSAETVEEMRRRHPALNSFVVPGQGHAPTLRDTATIDAVARFLATTDVYDHTATFAYA